MKRIIIDEKELRKIIRTKIMEQVSNGEQDEEQKPRCLTNNVINLDDIVGSVKDAASYSPGVYKRQNGVNSIVDTLGILNNIRLFKDIKDGGAHLSYEMMNHLNQFRNKNYYDETTGNCHKAMDKVIELYKEHEHGTELVKDIERILNIQSREDELTPSARSKEYLKQCLNLLKGK
jgi:hypothetical protein